MCRVYNPVDTLQTMHDATSNMQLCQMTSSAHHHVSVAVIPDLRVLFHPRMLSSDSWSTSNGVKPITATATTSL